MSDGTKRQAELETRLEKLRSHQTQLQAALAGARGEPTALDASQRRQLSRIGAQIRRITAALEHGRPHAKS